MQTSEIQIYFFERCENDPKINGLVEYKHIGHISNCIHTKKIILQKQVVSVVQKGIIFVILSL